MPADKTRPQVNLFRLEWFELKFKPIRKLNSVVSQSSHLFSELSKFMLQAKLIVPYANNVSSESLIRFRFSLAPSSYFLKIKITMKTILTPNPEKYVLTSSWFDTVKLNQGEATAIDIRKNPTNNSFIYFFK